MLDIEPHKVVVCVRPGDDYEASFHYAVARARRRKCGIHLVLAVRPLLVEPSGITDLRLVDGERRTYGVDFLLECEQRVKTLSNGEVQVTTEITHGTVVPALVEVSEHAAVVVMQHHRMERPARVPTLSVTNGVAAFAHAPVVAVPDAWREFESRPAVVAVGVEDAESSRTIVECAFEEAEDMGCSVRLVRAWFFSTAFDADVFEGQAALVQTAAVREQVSRDFASIREQHPDVPCETVAVHGRPADVLVEESRRVRLLVVGRHEPTLPLGSHLGPITRAVLGHAISPVLVVDPRH